MPFPNPVVFEQITLNCFWINFRESDCLTALLNHSAGDLPVQNLNSFGDCMITTHVSNTVLDQEDKRITTPDLRKKAPM